MNDGFAIFFVLVLSAVLGLAVWNEGLGPGLVIFGLMIGAFAFVGLCDRYFHPSKYR